MVRAPPLYPLEDYVALAAEVCEAPSLDSRRRVLLGMQDYNDHVGPRGFLYEEVGGHYVFVNAACELFMHAPDRSSELDYDQTGWAYMWEPPVYKKLSVAEAGYLMSRFRVLEWDRLEEGAYYNLQPFEPDFRFGFRGASYRVSYLYKATRDDVRTQRYEPLDWLIRAIVSYDPREDNAVMDGSTHYVGEEMRAVVQSANAESVGGPKETWELVEQVGLAHEWPLVHTPHDLGVQPMQGYILGTSSVITGPDALALRELVAFTLAEGAVPARRPRAIATTFEEEPLYLWAREALPMEDERGIIDAVGGRTTGWSTSP